MLDDAVKDPVIAKIKLASLRAATRLIEEVDSSGEDSSSMSRIKAAESILDRCGYTHKNEPQQNNVIFVSLSPDKLNSVLEKTEIKPQPSSVQG